jgi:hypothetical protein
MEAQMRRRVPIVLAAVFVAGVLVTPGFAAPSAGVHVLDGSNPQVNAVFPNDRFTVADSRQVTGRRVALPVPACNQANYSICDGIRLLNQLDGFDIHPRIYIPFSGAIDIKTVTGHTVYLDGGPFKVSLVQLVLDPVTHVLEGTAFHQLGESKRYELVVTKGVHDTHGNSITAGVRVPFTTQTASLELDKIRRSLDSGLAYSQAGIKAQNRGLFFQQGNLRTVFAGPSVVKEGIDRNDQTSADPTAPLTSSLVPDLVDPGTVGWYAFGSYVAPQFVTNDAVIPQVPTKQTPRALNKARLGFAMLLPNGKPPAGGWPVAIYGPGFTRSYFDLYVTADHNAALGLATIAIDPLGHGYGPKSSISVKHVPRPGAAATTSTFLSYGRGHDLDGDGAITEQEGVQPSDHKVFSNGTLIADNPSHYSLVGLRDGLIQTVSDVMTLVRAVERGVRVPTGLSSIALSPKNIRYYGLSFGAIYGTMFMGTDPHVRVGFLNAGGGPILDIARQSSYRDLLAANLKVLRPNPFNGGPGLEGFTESLPGATDPPITNPYPGSFRLRQFMSNGNWLERQGSPETFAPLLRFNARYGPKTVEFLNAFGDATVPNSATGNVIRAGNLFDRLTYYRNDKTPTNGTDPHGFMADPTLAGRAGAQQQLAVFLQSYGATVIDPDGPGEVFERPIVDPNNLQCLHYPDPQTGQTVNPPAASGPCGPVQH